MGSIEVPSKERLSLLRRLDRTHRWTSLRDQRYCTYCHAIFDGREVEIVGGTRAFGPLRLQCPSARCLASPAAWQRAIDGKAVAKEVGVDAVVLTHHGCACTLRRQTRASDHAAVAKRSARNHWPALRQAGLGLLNLVPMSLQQGRVIFQQLRNRAG